MQCGMRTRTRLATSRRSSWYRHAMGLIPIAFNMHADSIATAVCGSANYLRIAKRAAMQ